MSKFAPTTITDDDIAIASMPPLRHATEGEPYDQEQSEVLRWILNNTTAKTFTKAEALLRRAYHIGALEFLSSSRTWRGTGLCYRRIASTPKTHRHVR